MPRKLGREVFVRVLLRLSFSGGGEDEEERGRVGKRRVGEGGKVYSWHRRNLNVSIVADLHGHLVHESECSGLAWW